MKLLPAESCFGMTLVIEAGKWLDTTKSLTAIITKKEKAGGGFTIPSGT